MTLKPAIQTACGKIAPLWPLANFVAVNPFIGFSGRSFVHTAHLLKQIQDAEMTLPIEWYAEKHARGDISRENLSAAIERAPDSIRKSFYEAGEILSVETLVALSRHPRQENDSIYRPGSFTAYIDAREETRWQHTIREEAAKWCAAYYDRGQASWCPLDRESGFYAAWHAAAQRDLNLSCSGLKSAHKFLAGTPVSHEQAIDEALLELQIPNELTEEWVYRVLLNLPGWAGHLRYLDREKELRAKQGSELVQLLAVLLNYERVVYNHYSGDDDCMLGWLRMLMEEPFELANEVMPLDLATRLIWQSAHEHQAEQWLQTAVNPAPGKPPADEETLVQAAFCIDVRSEVFRRNLETTFPGIQTIGFAGFFGVPLSHLPTSHKREEARCPALLAPPVKSCEHSHDNHAIEQTCTSERSWGLFKDAAASCFSYVETLGLGYAWKLIHASLGLERKALRNTGRPQLARELPIEEKVAMATGILKGLTLTSQCGKLVLLCGHGSTTRNNPYASGLDCGACGGHPGDANARIAADLLNDPDVRTGLEAKGISLPADTVFIAGLHNTTTDVVTLYDQDQVPASHQALLRCLMEGIEKAGILTSVLRATRLDASQRDAVREVTARSRDWSQIRPEWGLAGNKGFLIAPRSWSSASDLDGKAFLHEYDPVADPQGSLLESIMAGPLIVGSWINLQYFASVSDNTHFGSGNKAIHNVVGGLGVALGNENDLRPGLPLQSIHNGRELMHEPLRLHALVAAEPSLIEAILNRQPELRQLLDNQWLHLFALGSDGSQFTRRLPGGKWASTPRLDQDMTGIQGPDRTIHYRL